MDSEKREVHVSFVRRYSQNKHICPVCSNEFVGGTLKIYCSDKCRKQAAWQRNGPAMNEKRRKKATEVTE
jgi:hypothetical protein